MPLILAVEPDRRRASQIAALVRSRLAAEFVIAETASRALETLADRVPDVLLTSPLLSGHDEATLAAHLRELGPAAAHVQALTIPILATSKPAESRRRGVLSLLRRQRQAATPDGCAPAVFAEQVVLYLERALAEREVSAALQPPPVDDITPVLELVSAPAVEPEPVLAVATEPEPVLAEPELVLAEPEPVLAATPEPEAAPAREPEPEPEKVIEPEPEPVLLAEPQPVSEPAWRPPAFLEPVSTLLFEALEAALEDDSWVDVPLEAIAEVPPTLPEPPDVMPEAEQVWVLSPLMEIEALVAATTPAPEPARAMPAESAAAVAVVEAPKPPAPAKKKPGRPKKGKPVQDEWGFFDPDQCGFAALLDKLDEITDRVEHRDDITVRVIH